MGSRHSGERPLDELVSSYRRKSFTVKLPLRTKFLSGAKSDHNNNGYVKKIVSQNKAKNAGRSGENAGNTSKCGISRTIAGWLTPMTPNFLT